MGVPVCPSGVGIPVVGGGVQSSIIIRGLTRVDRGIVEKFLDTLRERKAMVAA